jgi:hypothetical protein
MLRVVSDREVAREAARVNVSVLLLGQPRIVHPDGRLSAEKLRAALGRAGEELAMIRLAVSRLVAPDIPYRGLHVFEGWDRSGRRHRLRLALTTTWCGSRSHRRWSGACGPVAVILARAVPLPSWCF